MPGIKIFLKKKGKNENRKRYDHEICNDLPENE